MRTEIIAVGTNTNHKPRWQGLDLPAPSLTVQLHSTGGAGFLLIEHTEDGDD